MQLPSQAYQPVSLPLIQYAERVHSRCHHFGLLSKLKPKLYGHLQVVFWFPQIVIGFQVSILKSPNTVALFTRMDNVFHSCIAVITGTSAKNGV